MGARAPPSIHNQSGSPWGGPGSPSAQPPAGEGLSLSAQPQPLLGAAASHSSFLSMSCCQVSSSGRGRARPSAGGFSRGPTSPSDALCPQVKPGSPLQHPHSHPAENTPKPKPLCFTSSSRSGLSPGCPPGHPGTCAKAGGRGQGGQETQGGQGGQGQGAQKGFPNPGSWPGRWPPPPHSA